MIAVLQRSNIMKKIILFVLTTLLFSLCGLISLAEESDQEIVKNEIADQTKNEILQNKEFSVEENEQEAKRQTLSSKTNNLNFLI